MNLPIDVIPNTRPLKFKWRQVITSAVGNKTVEYEGEMPASVERAIESLIMIAKQLALENEELKKLKPATIISQGK